MKDQSAASRTTRRYYAWPLRGGTSWQPIETAPRDRPIVVYAPEREGLQEMASMCQWHPDAGFCIDELRDPTHWMEKPL